MSAAARPSIADQLLSHLTGPTAIPRKNGELVFQAPWESRAFGMAVALCEQGLYEWEEFRAHLIEEIADWERRHSPSTEYSYYERWLTALEQTLRDKGLCIAAEIDHCIAEQQSG
jgi:nitrile hydratase accessory protein